MMCVHSEPSTVLATSGSIRSASEAKEGCIPASAVSVHVQSMVLSVHVVVHRPVHGGASGAAVLGAALFGPSVPSHKSLRPIPIGFGVIVDGFFLFQLVFQHFFVLGVDHLRLSGTQHIP